MSIYAKVSLKRPCHPSSGFSWSSCFCDDICTLFLNVNVLATKNGCINLSHMTQISLLTCKSDRSAWSTIFTSTYLCHYILVLILPSLSSTSYSTFLYRKGFSSEFGFTFRSRRRARIPNKRKEKARPFCGNAHSADWVHNKKSEELKLKFWSGKYNTRSNKLVVIERRRKVESRKKKQGELAYTSARTHFSLSLRSHAFHKSPN